MGDHKGPQLRSIDGGKGSVIPSISDSYNEISNDTSQMQDEFYNNGKTKQGNQGSQIRFDSKSKADMYEKANTEARQLLSVEQSEFEVMLQRLYYSPECQYFYIVLMIASLSLVLVTVIKGFIVDQSPWFIFTELVINLCVLGDFLCRIKLQGYKKFFSSGLQNIFDAAVVGCCLLLFLLILLSKSGFLLNLEELSEELLLVAWSVFQTIRMIFIAKKQNLAQQSAKTLIDFTNIMESEAGDTSRQADEVIVFDMKQLDQRQRQSSQVAGRDGMYSSRRRNRARINNSNDIELQDIASSRGGNQFEKYKKQGLGGYDEDEESLDNSGKFEL